MNIVIVGTLPDRAKRLVRDIFPAEHSLAIVAPEELGEHLAQVEVLVPEHVAVDSALLARAGRLKLVQTGAGYENVAIDECTRKGIYVANAAGINAAAVAEHVLGLILCWYRNFILLDRAMKGGGYSIEYTGSELSEKTLGIVGLGHIGKSVARLARAFGMKVLCSALRPLSLDAEVLQVDLDALLRTADVVSLHTALNDRTRHLIGGRELQLMKPDAFLVNTSRGPVVDEEALIEALQTGRIGGAGLDVYEQEPLSADSPLRRLPNVILTPHTAGMPDGLKYCRKRYEFFLKNITLVSQGKKPVNALNQP